MLIVKMIIAGILSVITQNANMLSAIILNVFRSIVVALFFLLEMFMKVPVGIIERTLLFNRECPEYLKYCQLEYCST